MLVSRRFLGIVLGVCASSVVMLGVTTDVALAQAPVDVWNFTGRSDGGYPAAALIQAQDDNFYGTTKGGGASYSGTIFRMDASGALTTLHAFTGGRDGAY